MEYDVKRVAGYTGESFVVRKITRFHDELMSQYIPGLFSFSRWVERIDIWNAWFDVL